MTDAKKKKKARSRKAKPKKYNTMSGGEQPTADASDNKECAATTDARLSKHIAKKDASAESALLHVRGGNDDGAPSDSDVTMSATLSSPSRKRKRDATEDDEVKGKRRSSLAPRKSQQVQPEDEKSTIRATASRRKATTRKVAATKNQGPKENAAPDATSLGNSTKSKTTASVSPKSLKSKNVLLKMLEESNINDGDKITGSRRSMRSTPNRAA